MNKNYFIYKLLIFLLVFQCHHLFSQKQEDIEELFSLSIEELMRVKVKVASKTEESIFHAPSVVSVIGKEEIAQLNPRNITDILNVMPGFNYHTSNLGSPLFQLRGIHSVNDQILFLVDGHPLNDRIFGTVVYFINSIPVEEIQRLEVIRGPGSAIYGANAFYAVINLVTLRDEPDESTRIISKLGSENTVQGTAIIRRKTDNQDGQLLVSGTIAHTEGPNQEFTDRNGTEGNISFEQGKKHLYLNYTKGFFGFKGLYNNEILGPFAGISYYLNDRTLRKYTTIALEASTEYKITNNWRVLSKIYWDSFIYDCFWEYVPPAILPPNGFITDAFARDYRLGAELTAEGQFSDKHRVLLGVVNDFIGITDSRAEDNLPDYGYQYSEVPGSWIANGKDRNYAFYIQDNYFMTNTLQLVLGMRYDNHTAYGDSWNPRCGITQKLGKNGHTKFLYGQAFRAPNNWDLYSNSADQIKNPNLAPEKIQTLEAEFSYILFNNFVTRINFYHNTIEDLILKSIVKVDGIETNMKKNLGKIEVNGIEAEIKGKIFTNDHRFNINGFFNRSRDVYHGEDMFNVPNYGGVLIFNNNWHKRISTNFQLRHIGEIGRRKEDYRPPIAATTTVNLSVSLRYKNINIKGSVYNIGDVPVYSPSPHSYLNRDYPYYDRTLMISFELSH